MPQLNWLGDAKARRANRHVAYRLLETVEQVGDAESHNLLLQGDNLEALKALLPLYAGKVKCIFIDPPYNTKSAFEHYDDNLEHSQWLSMMYPRLVLLRELLSEDGSIWVTIDDNEAHYLKVVMDEVFGRRNFVANVVWQKAYTANQTAKHISDTHDHLLFYAKSVDNLRLGKISRTEEQESSFKNPDNDPRGPWKAENLSAGKFYSAGQFTIVGPTGTEFHPPVNRYWRCNETQYRAWLNDGRITFGLKGTGRPMLKKFLAEMQAGLTATTWWSHDEVGSNKEASVGLKLLLAGTPDLFQTPKPERLLRRLLDLSTQTGEVVLDSFLGSGTTAAVAHKMGRRWIGIEMGEHARTHCLPRLKKVVEGEQGGISQAVGWQGGGGFRFATLGEPVFDEDGRINAGVRFAALAAHLWFAETKAPHATQNFDSPLLGVHGDTAIMLLYNGVLGDRRPQGGNVLTHAVWEHVRGLLPQHSGRWRVYGEANRLGPTTLKRFGIDFRQIPYDIGAR
jgi:adenine-specific DNA-methyltransferase